LTVELTVDAQHPVEPLLHEILSQALRCADRTPISIFVGGAMARDILLRHVFGLKPGRATKDVDLGLYLDSWEQFHGLKESLIESGCFKIAEKSVQRLLYMPKDMTLGIPLDLVPFGPVANAQAEISWPPEHEIVMNVSGFEEAHRSAVTVDIGQGLKVKVCSLPSLSVLKLIAWNDRGLQTSKDAQDFVTLCKFYGDAGIGDRIYQGDASVLAHYEYDMAKTGSYFLGVDAQRECSPENAKKVIHWLQDEQWRRRMVDSLLRAGAQLGGNSAPYEALIQAYLEGFRAST
jgi:predicted nucleotidyltransferase